MQDRHCARCIGDAGLGLALRQGQLTGAAAADAACMLDRHQLPEPRLALGQALVGIASASLDISDGLIADLGHICETSGAAARIEIEQVPLSAAARRQLDRGAARLPDLLVAGDDYELCFTVPRDRLEQLSAIAQATAVPITRIGGIASGRNVVAVGADGQPVTLAATGYRHF